ncbi:MAG: NrdH-redoxin [Acidimicrobiales bacterium]|nr:NrdH-redoxin [Acidimicrobiales bacterium]
MNREQAPPVVFYWRPGCGFCTMLQRNLDGHGIAYDSRNIWEDGDAAASVRSIANGNETVPTVLIGDTALVNPTIDQVLDALSRG